jgi:hypothetical protein
MWLRLISQAWSIASVRHYFHWRLPSYWPAIRIWAFEYLYMVGLGGLSSGLYWFFVIVCSFSELRDRTTLFLSIIFSIIMEHSAIRSADSSSMHFYWVSYPDKVVNLSNGHQLWPKLLITFSECALLLDFRKEKDGFYLGLNRQNW